MSRIAPVLALLLIAVAVAAVGCTAKQPSPPPAAGPASAGGPPGQVTLTVWDWHAADPSKGVGLWLANIDKTFEAAHPGLKINHVAQSHTEYYEILKTAAAAADPQRGPDVVMLHQGSRVLDQRQSLVPLDKYVTPETRKEIVGWELVSDDYDATRTPWAVPIAVQGLVWYYNKALLREVGLDPEKPPAKWGEFLAACDALRKAGKAGIAVGEKEGFWADWFLNSAYLQTCSAEDRPRLRSGEMKWTDPSLVAVLVRLQELADRNCFQKGALSTPLFPDAGEVFMRGDAGFFLGLISDVAHWKEFGDMMGAEKVGVMTCPVFQESPDASKFPVGGAFTYAITKWSLHPSEAFQYIAFIAGDENARTFLTEVGSFPANQSFDHSLIADPNAQKIAQWLAAGRTGPQLGDMLPAAIGEAFRREAQSMLAGTTTVAGALEAVEKAAQESRRRGE